MQDQSAASSPLERAFEAIDAATAHDPDAAYLAAKAKALMAGYDLRWKARDRWAYSSSRRISERSEVYWSESISAGFL